MGTAGFVMAVSWHLTRLVLRNTEMGFILNGCHGYVPFDDLVSIFIILSTSLTCHRYGILETFCYNVILHNSEALRLNYSHVIYNLWICCGSLQDAILILRPEGEGKSDGNLWWVLNWCLSLHISLVKTGQKEAGNTPLL